MRKSLKQRHMIMNYMYGACEHVSAEQIFKDLNASGQKISLATVYRNLNILVEMNEIKKIAHSNEGYRYDITCRPHYHLHCIKCDRIVDLEIPYDEELQKMLIAKSGLAISSHSVMAEGVCEKCAGKKK